MKINDLEIKYKNQLSDIEEWAYIRVALGEHLLNKDKGVFHRFSYYKRVKDFFKYLWDIFYGFSFWFKKYQYLFFSDSAERREIDGTYVDKLSDDIIERLSIENSLMIELPNPKHYSRIIISTKNIVSQIPLKILARVLKKIQFNETKLKVLNDIFYKEKISFDFIDTIKTYKASYIVYKILLKIYKPKLIFINCYYCRFGLIEAAKELGINVIEIQHGVINNEHFAYRSIIEVNQKYLPNILLSFGENETKLKDRLIKKNYPIGSFYLEHIENNFQINSNLLNIIEPYKYVVGVSLQEADWERSLILDFLIKCANSDSTVLYILIPRKRKDFLVTFPSNIIIYDRLDCYNIILHCNVHCSLYSSCALEAPSLGIPNILIDIDGFASKYYKNILSNAHTKYVTTEENFFVALKELAFLKKNFIQNKNKNIFLKNYNDNIVSFLKKLEVDNAMA